MEKLYYYETIEEYEKDIIDKAIILDIVYACTSSLFECFVRTIRTIMSWVLFIGLIGMIFAKNTIFSHIVLTSVIIYAIGYFLMSWVKFNHNRSYSNMKVQLVDNMLLRCKEYQETKYEEWQQKQMLKRFASLVNISLDWDKVK